MASGYDRSLSGRHEIRKRLLKYTRKAFRMIPGVDTPRILDIGCGSGVATLELAKLSGGDVTGIDIDKPALEKLAGRIKEMGLSDRVRVMDRSMFDMDFPDESFDIVWAEGSIYAIGFERGLREWKRLIKPGGCLVVHDEQGDVREKLEQISDRGYELLDYFMLSQEIWWAEYFASLEKWLAESGTIDIEDTEILEELRRARSELDMYRKYPDRNSSVIFVMKKD